jgi:ArsR family transcriptional regulator
VARPKAVIEVTDEIECWPSVIAAPLDPESAAELAFGFSALGDPVRLRVLSMLAAAPDGEICVCEFIEPLGKPRARSRII